MINNKKVLSIITARAGSKGLPCKNYKEINGFPLVCWSMLDSMKSEYIDITVISSNCPHVKDAYSLILKKIRNGVLDKSIYKNK